MHFTPVEPGDTSAANMAAPLAPPAPEPSLCRATVPADQLFAWFDVVALKTEYDDADTKRPVARIVAGMTTWPSIRRMRRGLRMRRNPPGSTGGAGAPPRGASSDGPPAARPAPGTIHSSGAGGGHGVEARNPLHLPTAGGAEALGGHPGTWCSRPSGVVPNRYRTGAAGARGS